jgi:hypothetical protein
MNKIIFLLSLVAFVACETELDTIGTPINDSVQTTGNTNNLITAEEAAAQALEFRQSLMAENGLTRSAGKDKGVASVYAWRTSKVLSKAPTRSSLANILPDTLLYIVNFEQNSGYALVSATKEVPGVVAYIDNGGLTPDQPIDNPGFNEFLENYGENYASIRDSLIGGRFRDSMIIGNNRHFPDSLIEVCKDSFLVETPKYKFVKYVAPLLSTTWGQVDPYNYDCPIYDHSNGSHAKVGCVAVAIGQVLAHYKWPKSYNNHNYDWISMLHYSCIPDSDAVASQNVATLLADIGNMVSMDYSNAKHADSRANFDSVQYCLNDLGYHYYYVKDATTHNGTDFNTIMQDVENSSPVIIMGAYTIYERTGHAWVIDGIAVKKEVDYSYISLCPNPTITINTKQYVHCNWGENGLCNGWFLFGGFGTMYNVNTDEEMTGIEAMISQAYYTFNKKNYAYHQVYPQ